VAQQVQRVAAEDLVDAGGREAAVAQQGAQVVELVVAGQDRAVVPVQVGAEGHMARADRLGEPGDLGAEVGEGSAGDAAGPGADQAAGLGDRSRVPCSHQPGVPDVGGVSAGIAELAVRDDHRLAGRRQHGHGRGHAGVRAVDHDAQPVALGHHIAAEPAQAAVHRRLGLHVADLADPVVHQGEHGEAGRAGLLEPPQVTLEEVAALAAEQHHGAPVAGGLIKVGR
jgi:hypothetical protein